MIQKFIHRSLPVSAFVLALVIPATYAAAQTRSAIPATTTTTTGTATPQGITGGDPTPIRWPPSSNLNLRMK